jgi:ABC-type Fe3+/spermidine/putrescine transport system ATPase subunit
VLGAELPPSQAAIVFENVVKRFGSATALDDVSVRVEQGAFVSLLGPSGCGKTTLLRIIGGFEKADSGNVFIHGQLVDRLPPNKRPINTVFQRYALFPHKTVFENVAFPLVLRGAAREEQRARVAAMLDLVRLPGVEARMPAQLSGGQAQRVALARALVGQPEVLLLDEPLAALDLKLRKAMQLELRRIQEDLGTSFLYVTHDQEEALTMSDKIVLMNDGHIAQEGSASEIYNHPANVFASSFIGEANLLHGTVQDTDGETACVALDGGIARITAPANGLTAGQTVVVSIRPERLHLSQDGMQPPGSNIVTGTLERSIFLGNVVRAFATLCPDLVVMSQRSVDAAHLQPGEPVTVSWRPEDTILLPEKLS